MVSIDNFLASRRASPFVEAEPGPTGQQQDRDLLSLATFLEVPVRRQDVNKPVHTAARVWAHGIQPLVVAMARDEDDIRILEAGEVERGQRLIILEGIDVDARAAAPEAKRVQDLHQRVVIVNGRG
jgi:hypothetical protein